MQSLWVIQLIFKPAGPLTFRRMPSGILHIMTYPFMPPTTMSGFLARLLLIADGHDWPGYGKDWYGEYEIAVPKKDENKGLPKPKKRKTKGESSIVNVKAGVEFTLTLDPIYRSLGAFPDSKQWNIHKTRRHGPKNFNHGEFSELFRTSHRENYQLHHWDYLFCEELIGWVVSPDKEALSKLNRLKNYGGKVGKEGFLVVVSVGAPQELKPQKGIYKPLGLVPQPARPSNGTFYMLYGHHWSKNYLWSDGSLGGVDGYFQIGAWWGVEKMDGFYWSFQNTLGFPINAPDAFFIGDDVPRLAGDLQ